MHILHSMQSLICMPQEIKELIFSHAVGHYDDIVDNRHFVNAVLTQLLTLRLISKRLAANSPYTRELFVRLQTLRFVIPPSLLHLKRSLPQAAQFLNRLQCAPLPRSSFSEPQKESLWTLTFPCLGEIIVDVGTVDFADRATVYWRSTSHQRNDIKHLVVRAVLAGLPHPRPGAILQLRYNVQYNLEDTAESLVRSTPVQRVYITLELAYVGGNRWREVSHAECLHLHVRDGGRCIARLADGIRVVYGEGFVWRRRRSMEKRDVISSDGWACECT